VLPLVELAVGLLLLLGLFTRVALVVGGLTMVVLLFGTAMVEDWGAIPSQLIHAVFFAVLIQFIQYNAFAVDKLSKRS
jgi:thiosulfate dehydrogenase [quinone] large subunit